MSAVESVSIQPIDKATVNQICSGQVVLNLATAVKELIENSIDALADSIQVKLEEYGSESIEVVDNGCGVEEVNFQALTLKHHTSKIKEFADLYSVETFGFRGEALSSLCSLSDVTIVTQHKNANIGATLKFDHNGIITSHVKTFRKIGTTVRLENLFKTLPIRRTEFLKNLKKEFTKLCSVLYAYGLQSKGIRITATNSVSKSKVAAKDMDDTIKRSTTTNIMDSKGISLESNIISIFGIKQKQNLLKIIERTPSEETLLQFNLQANKLKLDMFKIEGYISSCAHGCGRGSSDRQFYFINSRPVDNPKLSKLVNEIYHQYNNRQDPFVVLNVTVACGLFDMNLTPDKRQILLQNEKLLYAVLKESLLATFETIPSTLQIQNINPKFEPRVLERVKFSPSTSNLSSSFKWWQESRSEKRETLPSNDVCDLSSSITCTPNNSFDVDSGSSIPAIETQNLSLEREIVLQKPPEYKVSAESENKIAILKNSICALDSPKVIIEEPKQILELPFLEEKHNEFHSVKNLEGLSQVSGSKPVNVQMQKTVIEESTQSTTAVENKRKFQIIQNDLFLDDTEPTDLKRLKFDEGLTKEEKERRKVITINTSLDEIRRLLFKSAKNFEKKEDAKVKFLSEIKPQCNERAEDELKRELSKENFSQMEILGQFNLGFIITKLESDIFIIDQHASDEKYNYETLKETTVLQTQKLFYPEKLELTVDKEELMLQYREVFKKNGFDFVYDKASPFNRISLTSIPMSKNIVFNKNDVEELLFLLEDAPEVNNIRPSKVDSMFASRACRKSVMIGTALNHQEMRKIVNHMGEMEQPWNCPHGRPTMRHLVNLQMILLDE